MQWGKAVPSRAIVIMTIVSLHKGWSKHPPAHDSTHTSSVCPVCLWQLWRPLYLCLVALLHWSTALLSLVICQHHASFIQQTPPRIGVDQSCGMSWQCRWSVGITLMFRSSYLVVFGSSQPMPYLRQGPAEQDACAVLKACSILQRSSITMTANLNAKLFLGLRIPCNFD